MLPLIGVGVIVLGFALRFNPLLVVVCAAMASGLAAGLGPLEVLAAFGKAFNQNRYVSIVWVILPAIGVLERSGLQERARTAIRAMTAATAGRILVAYLLARQLTAALGLISIAGHAQTVRPLVAPMSEAAAENQAELDETTRDEVKAMSAATDNVGVFFGEDIFMAIGSILLIVGFLDQNGLIVEPLHLSVWAIPTAIAAFLVHGARLLLFDRKLSKRRAPRPEATA
ncbi:DUF969 domain-containing protein [Caulobacter endophyticus]|uniref:DUF969 domain-containing protein n=1 Tax=Caulobacter endophyticus TaxID=2172652 RepID=A0A2T9KCV2_9CAUL|nr:DUF969 domain-containing protein [Caulobacter endophyticus]PVM93776.1 DUF969 domain-containing protein [Caulobacter endophyticus]